MSRAGGTPQSGSWITEDDDFDAIARGLRRMARGGMYRIGARDLLGIATLDETLDGITSLAEAALRVATDRLRALHARETGDAVDDGGRPIPFVVLGLGKLGGQDLSYSSDIDVAYYYAHDAPMAGGHTAREFFSRLAKEISRAIGDTTADGQVFRVDLRLRPEGGSGPLVNTVANALMYYEGWGDTWERGVYIKARPVAGDHALGDELIEGIRPFVFRRHLDYQTIEDFRAMKERIDAEQSVRRMRSGGVRDVKLGAGGIRELEFGRGIVDAFGQVLGQELPVQFVAPGEPISGLPEIVPAVLAAMETYDSPIPMDETARTFGVEQVTLASCIRHMLSLPVA